jgi:DNA repair exonuclease SbcCD ATPase subunit
MQIKEKPSKQFCSIEKKECKKFEKPLEKLLLEYWIKKNAQEWVDLPIPISCLRPVEGRLYGTFEELFYSLLPYDMGKQIKEIDRKLNQLYKKKGELEAKIKEYESKNKDTAALKKELDNLEKEIKNQEALQEKLYNDAIKQIEIDPRKIALAKKLYLIADYVEDTDNKLFLLVSGNLAKFFLDLFEALKYAPQIGVATVATVAAAPNSSYAKRLKFLLENVLVSPGNIVSIYGYIIAQKNLVGRYKDYLAALVEMEKKINQHEKKEK